MTELEWLACQDVREMLDWLPTRTWRRVAVWLDRGCGPLELRRFLFFANACFTRIPAASVYTPHPEGLINELPLPQETPAEDYPTGPWNEGVSASAAVTVEAWAGRWADAAARCIAWGRAYSSGHLDWAEFKRARELERSVQAGLLRCVYGNPFAPTPSVDLDWLESRGQAAGRLARDIAARDAFWRIPELADTLERAGCEDAAVVAHCREPGPHALGCWAIELLAGESALPEILIPTAPEKEAARGDLKPPAKRRSSLWDIPTDARGAGSDAITRRPPRLR